ncbi:MAG: CotH kinase family protein [Verrucomicrobiia bacterium]
MKKQNSTNAWEILVHAIDVLNNTAAAELRDKVEDVLAVDRWLWFLVLENLFADDDSYWNKGADYMFYYEPESGRIHPVEHDGNESFMANDSRLSPVTGATTARPVLYKLLGIPELRQRYLAHMRTVMEESYNPATLTALIDRFHRLSVQAIAADPKKGFTMATYTNDLRALKTFITNRYNFLSTHAELTPVAPAIIAVAEPEPPDANQSVFVTATVDGAASGGVQSVWLYLQRRCHRQIQPHRDVR